MVVKYSEYSQVHRAQVEFDICGIYGDITPPITVIVSEDPLDIATKDRLTHECLTLVRISET